MVLGLHAQPHAILVPKQEVGKWHKLPEMGVKDVVVLHLIPDLATGKDVQYQQHQLLQQLGQPQQYVQLRQQKGEDQNLEETE